MSGKRKVLLIDDDEAVISYLVMKLSKQYDVVSTTDSRLAVTMAKQERPDVILCDIDMPHLSGGDVAAALTDDPETAFVPFVYLTALVTPEEARELAGHVGGRPGVAKRAPIAELVAVIDRVCDRR